MAEINERVETATAPAPEEPVSEPKDMEFSPPKGAPPEAAEPLPTVNETPQAHKSEEAASPMDFSPPPGVPPPPAEVPTEASAPVATEQTVQPENASPEAASPPRVIEITASPDTKPLTEEFTSPEGAKRVRFGPSSVFTDIIVMDAVEATQEEVAAEEEADFGHRLYKHAMEKRTTQAQRMEEAAKLAAERELQGVTFKPETSQQRKALGNYKNFGEFLHASDTWVKQQHKKMTVKAAKIRNEIEEDFTYKAEMDKRSQKIVNNMRKSNRYESPVAAWKSHCAKHILARSGSKSPGPSSRTPNTPRGNDHHPIVSPLARAGSPARNDAVFNHLYTDAVMRQAAKSIVEHAREVNETKNMFHPNTNNTVTSALYLGHARSRTPNGSDGDSSRGSSMRPEYDILAQRTPQEAVQSLLEKGAEYKARAEWRREQSSKVPANCTFKPQTNSMSQRLVKEWYEKRQMQQAQNAQRREGAIKTLLSGAIPAESPSETEFLHLHTPRNTETPRSAVGASTMEGVKVKKPAVFDVQAFSERVAKRQEARAMRLSTTRVAVTQTQLSECTFRPKLAKVSEQLYKRSFESVESPTTASQAPRSATPRSSLASPRHNRAASDPDLWRGVPHQVHDSPPPTARTAATPQSRTMDPDAPFEYLDTLEKELRSVIAEWQDISVL